MTTNNQMATVHPVDQALAAARADNDQFRVLDVYAEDGITTVETRMDALATISAGFRGAVQDGRVGRPQRSTDGTIYVHGLPERSRRLREILKRNGGKGLTIAFPFDQLSAFIQQRYVLYSATRLEAYGDERGITYTRVQGEGKDATATRHFYAAGTEGFAKLLARVKASVSVYFVLAEWTETGARIIMPDGAGLYRLRFTSRNSLRNLIADIRYVQQFTHGRIAGVPFELSIDYREVSDATGAKRNVPVWCAVSRPPGGITLSSENWRGLISSSLQQGAALMLPAPSPESMELAALEGPAEDLDEITVELPSEEQLTRGATCDAAYWKRRWGAIVDGTRYDTAEGRANFVRGFTREAYGSLAAFLSQAGEHEASELIAYVQRHLAADEIEAARQSTPALGGVVERTALPPPGEHPGAGFGGRSLAEIGYDLDDDEVSEPAGSSLPVDAADMCVLCGQLLTAGDIDAHTAMHDAAAPPYVTATQPAAEADAVPDVADGEQDELDNWYSAIRAESTRVGLRRLKPQIVALKTTLPSEQYGRLVDAWTKREAELNAPVPA